MIRIPSAELTWVLLIALTFLGIGLGEGTGPGLWINLLVAAITALKGRLVIDQFMEIRAARPGIRRAVRAFGLLVPILILVLYFFGPQIARLTTL